LTWEIPVRYKGDVFVVPVVLLAMAVLTAELARWLARPAARRLRAIRKIARTGRCN
jgi:hypothetical protein